MHNAAASENKMGTMPIGKLITSMSVPTMASMLIMALYNIVDSIFVAYISADALVAVSFAYAFQAVLNAVAVGTGMGICSLVSKKLGERDQEAANAAASAGQFLALASGLFFGLLYYLFSRPLLEAFGATGEVLVLSTEYLSVCGTFCLPSFLQVVSEKTLQGTGNTIHPMLIQLTGALINVVLDPILIFGLLGFSAMGVAGAAVATVIGQTVAMILSLYLLYIKNKLVSIRLFGGLPKIKLLRDIYALALPVMIMQGMGAFVNLALNKIVSISAPSAVGVLGIYYKLQSFAYLPVLALNASAVSILSYNYGAKDWERMKKAIKLGILFALFCMVVGLVDLHVFPHQLLALFQLPLLMVNMGTKALRRASLCFPFAGVCIVLSAFFQAIGKGKYSLLISVLRQFAMVLPLAYIASRYFGLDAIWYAFPIAETLSMFLYGVLYVRMSRKVSKELSRCSIL
jgi:putative MATE family efflux protein